MSRLLSVCAVSIALAGAVGCSGTGCGAAPAEESSGTTVTDDGRTRTTTTDHGSRGRVVEQTNSTGQPRP